MATEVLIIVFNFIMSCKWMTINLCVCEGGGEGGGGGVTSLGITMTIGSFPLFPSVAVTSILLLSTW